MTLIWRDRVLGLLLAAAIFGIDQWVKHLVTGPLGLRAEGDHLDLLPIFDFTLTHNLGVSLGMFPANSREMRWGLVGVTGLIALVVSVWLLRERKLGDILPLGMILGGALGNILDRARHGYVVDFADLHFGTFRPFLVFNVGDAAISIAVVILLLRAFLTRKEPETGSGPEERTEHA